MDTRCRKSPAVICQEKNIALIEGNHDPGHGVVQMIAQTGLHHEGLKIVNDRR